MASLNKWWSAWLRHEAEAVERVDRQQTQPEVERHTREHRKEYSLFRVRFHRLPWEEGRDEGDEEDKAVEEEEDDD